MTQPQRLEEVKVVGDARLWMWFSRLHVDLFQVGLNAAMRTVVLVVLEVLTTLVEVMDRRICIAGSTLKELALPASTTSIISIDNKSLSLILHINHACIQLLLLFV